MSVITCVGIIPGRRDYTVAIVEKRPQSHRVTDASSVKSSRMLPGHTLGHLSRPSMHSTFHFELIVITCGA